MPKKISYFRNRADKLLQELGRLTYDKCLICGRAYSCLHHFMPKSSCSALRYEWDNLIPICSSCHLGIHSNRGASLIGKIIGIKGQDWFDALEKKKIGYLKTNITYYNDVIKRLEKVTKKICQTN